MTATQAAIGASGAEALALLREGTARLVSIFGSGDDGDRCVHYILDVDKQYRVFTTRVSGPVPAATAVTPAAAWY